MTNVRYLMEDNLCDCGNEIKRYDEGKDDEMCEDCI